MMKPDTLPGTILVLGGTSDIGRAIARLYAEKGWQVQLAGRNLTGLQREADDVAVRMGASISVHEFDVLNTASFPAFLDGLPTAPDTVVCVVGLLGDQMHAERDMDQATLIMRSNFEGPALILGELANRFEARGYGTIVGVSSVAGDRGRASNYIYGSAKAGFSAFLSGLRNRLARGAVQIITVKPGFVRTRMTKEMKLPNLLTTDPAVVARSIHDAIRAGRTVLYVSPIWRFIMTAVVIMPEPIFKRMRI